jgi:VWFA-related protein
MTTLKTRVIARYLLVSLAIIFSAMVITGCGGGGGDSSTSGTPNIGLVPATTVPTDFGVTVLGKSADKHIEIWNTGGANLSVGQITQPAGPFSVTDTCSNTNIPPSSNCQLTIHFAPITQGDYNSSFEIPSNDSDAGVLTATLTGKGRALNTSINRVTRVGNTVQVIVSVRNQLDDPVSNLVESNFSITEDGSAKGPFNVSNTMTPPVSVGMVLDYSSTTIPLTAELEVAAKSFVDLLDPAKDEAEVIKFAEDWEVMQPFTDNQVALKDAIDEPPSFQRMGTALYDTLVESVNATSLQSNSRLAIVAVSDGKDTRSTQTISDVTAGATANNVQIFTIGIGPAVDNATLQTLATDTGGEYFFDPAASDLTTIYATISEILSNEYTITYTTSSAVGSTISINVVVDDNGQIGESTKTVTL